MAGTFSSSWRGTVFFALLTLAIIPAASAQRSAKYGSDFLSGGVGARPLGMGGAYVALANDVTAGYWNPAGLGGMYYPEFAYMHAERFAGVVSYDYGSGAFPINSRSSVGLSIIRLGVDDIPNTLNAWDRDRNTPLPNAGDRISRFSYAHYAFFVSYARAVSQNLTVGVSGKMIRGSIGEFASSWGYSLDVGMQYRTGPLLLGINLQDATRMLQTWSINEAAFAEAQVNYNEFAIPEGGAEYVLPVARLGSGLVLPVGQDNHLTFGLDVDLAFDGQRSYAVNTGDVSFHPRFGTEFSYRGVVALRAGINQVNENGAGGLSLTPAVGGGLHLKQISVDYGFGDFAGLASDLGYSHRISLQLRLDQPRFKRAER